MLLKNLKNLKKLNNTSDIKVITGIRRSGKSVLMQDYIEYEGILVYDTARWLLQVDA